MEISAANSQEPKQTIKYVIIKSNLAIKYISRNIARHSREYEGGPTPSYLTGADNDSMQERFINSRVLGCHFQTAAYTITRRLSIAWERLFTVKND